MAAWAIPFGLAGALAHAILLDNRHAFVVFILAVLGMYVTRSGRQPPTRGQVKRAVVEDSPGDVMSM